jgi:spore coat protein A
MIGRRQLLMAAALAVPGSCRRRGRSQRHAFEARARKSAAPLLPPLHPETLARFVDPLPIPAVLEPDAVRPDPDDPRRRVDYYRVAMRVAEGQVHRDLLPTRFWTYGGSVPGPTLEVRSGRGVLVEWRNELPEEHFLPVDRTLPGANAGEPDVRAVVHVHGARVPAASDGNPEDWFVPGKSLLGHYPNRQEAATLWYHDHAMGVERLNQYAGLFGMYLIRDDVEDRLDLPRGPHDVPLVIFDRFFSADGQLRYPTSETPGAPWVPEVLGDTHLVNGKIAPYLAVEPRRYRFRLLNASNGRFYDLSLSNGEPFRQIGSDQGLLAAPAAAKMITLAPGERADVIVDFADAAGESVVLQSRTLQLLQFRVAGGRPLRSAPLPARLRLVPKLEPLTATATRLLTLEEFMDPESHVSLMLLNKARWHEPVTERPRLDSVEIWSFVNLTEDTHPIHLHLVRFQLLDRQPFDADEYMRTGVMTTVGKPVPPAPGEAGWKDTVRADAGVVTRIIVRFEGYAGRYAWHCHVLEHAANEMMRPYEIVKG